MGKKTWTPESIAFLKTNYGTLSYLEISEAIGISVDRIKSQASNLKITRSKAWPKDKIDLLRELYPNVKTERIASQVGKTITQVYAMAKKLGLSKSDEFLNSEESGRLTKNNADTLGAATRFKAGQIPWNKGKKIGSHPNSARTQFKSGQRPHNWLPVGAEVVATIGYKKIKIAEPNVWEFSHHRLWREHHGDPPPSHMIYFKDGDRMNVTVENLAIASRQEWMRWYTIQNYPEDLKTVIRQLAGLKRRINTHGKKQDRRPKKSTLRNDGADA